MKTPVLVFAILLIVSPSYAQSRETGIGYFTKEWLQTKSPTAAAYYRTIQINGDSSAYILHDYFVPSGKVYMEVECNALVPAVVFHGKMKRYYQNGVLQEEGQYDHGHAFGVFTTYYNTGKPCERSEYQGGYRDCILQYYSPDGHEQIASGKGVMRIVNANGDSLHAEVEDNNIRYTYSIHAEDTIYASVEREAEYPGGMVGLMNYLMKVVKYPSEARNKRIQGSVFTSFIVDERGKITDMTVVKSVSPELDAEAVRVIGTMKAWQPATIGAKAVKSRFVLPIKFKLGLGY
ncbi:TonB family protein [Fulvivirgaceae bacterium PWU5]|uniref:TonB family protein n=1 Tax=Dawidia cretensis TaxID=2782350 RepID=A0AAP2DZ63_9BACT|nr:energy transducer TonB [Dawidia cretensis]MBT1710011.1 TonB family protein [Dawidia cretensis]